MENTHSSLPSGSAVAEIDKVRVMVVDDSAVIRGLITRTLEGDPMIRVVASVANGEMAIAAAQKHAPEFIILDIEMPIMDGITAIPKLLEINRNFKIIMASSLTIQNAEISLRALELGAVDYIAKPSSTREMMGTDRFSQELLDKIKALGQAHKRGIAITPATVQQKSAPAIVAVPKPIDYTLRTAQYNVPDAIAIGSSTGGPQALFEVMRSLKGIRQPIFITQHMPATFTTILAQHITRQSGVNCVEAQEGMIIEPGRAYLAPGDHHFTLRQFGADKRVTLNQDPPENFCRPAVDPMLRSLSAIYGKRLLIAILTGMGSDGMRGSEVAIHEGASVIAQDEATSAVWGMPGAVTTAGLASAVLPLTEIGPFLRAQATKTHDTFRG